MFKDLWFRLRALFRRKSVETELDEELRFHLERQAEKYVRAGLDREEARHRARLEFGGYEQVKEEYRDARGVSLIETLARDVRYGFRALRSNPGFSTVAILTLALGIGANTAIFSVIDSVLLRPLPYADPDRLVMVWESLPGRNPHNTVSPPDFLDWGSRNSVFSGMAALFDQRANLTGNGQPQEVVLQDVTANFFSILGVNPILGTGFTAENGQPGHDDVLVLSCGFWKERYGGDSSIIGKTITLNGHPLMVVGVAPEGFDWFIKDSSLTGAKPQMWTPWIIPQAFHDRKNVGRFMTVAARLKPGATVQQARVQMNTIAAQIAQEYPDFNGHWGANVVPVTIKIGILLRDLSGNCVHLNPRLLHGCAGFQTRGHGQETADVLSIMKGLRNNPRRPHLRFCAGKRAVFNKPVEAFRGNAHNHQGVPVQRDGLADDGRIAAVALFPEAAAQNQHIIMAGLAVFRRETRTQDGIHAKNREEIRRDVLQHNFLRLPISGEVCALIE